FLFPVSKWVGGILFEHTHRLIASAVGFLTIILAIWLWRSEGRSWVRNLGLVALAGVILQGILGGLRVTMLKDEIGTFHACVAQAFLALLVFVALVTTNFWRSLAHTAGSLEGGAPATPGCDRSERSLGSRELAPPFFLHHLPTIRSITVVITLSLY